MKMKKTKKQNTLSRLSALLLLAAAFLTTIMSCQNGTKYHTYIPVDPDDWKRTDTLVFTLPQALPPSLYLFEIGIRHDDSYLYRDLWLTTGSDTLHLYLADSIGNWKGNGIGNIRLFTAPVRPLHSPHDSLHGIRIRHIMRDTPLKGIHDIGIRISVPSGSHPSGETRTAE